MQAIRSTNTTPEMAVRRLVHAMGYRYRLHSKHLPGKPDIVFGPRRKVVFVHGCFWHQHTECTGGRRPRTNLAYWEPKLSRNQLRDEKVKAELLAEGWEVLTIWECEIKNLAGLAERICNFLRLETP